MEQNVIPHIMIDQVSLLITKLTNDDVLPSIDTPKIPILHFNICTSLSSDWVLAEFVENVDYSPEIFPKISCLDVEFYSLQQLV